MPQHSMMCWPLHQRARLHRWSRPAPTASMCTPTPWTQWQADTLPCTSLYTKCTGRPKLPASTTIFISLRRRLCKQLGPSTGNISAASFLHKKRFGLNFLLSTDHVAEYMTVATSRVTTICSCDSLVHIRMSVAQILYDVLCPSVHAAGDDSLFTAAANPMQQSQLGHACCLKADVQSAAGCLRWLPSSSWTWPTLPGAPPRTPCPGTWTCCACTPPPCCATPHTLRLLLPYGATPSGISM